MHDMRCAVRPSNSFPFTRGYAVLTQSPHSCSRLLAAVMLCMCKNDGLFYPIMQSLGGCFGKLAGEMSRASLAVLVSV